MNIKLCFNNEIHRISKLPASFKALLEVVQVTFKNSLPPHYALQYEDSDGDRITLAHEEDYKSMIDPSSKNSIKVYVVSKENADMSFSQAEIHIVHETSSNQVLEVEISEEKVEEVLKDKEQPKEEKNRVPKPREQLFVCWGGVQPSF
jgi:hypothetical protein